MAVKKKKRKTAKKKTKAPAKKAQTRKKKTTKKQKRPVKKKILATRKRKKAVTRKTGVAKVSSIEELLTKVKTHIRLPEEHHIEEKKFDIGVPHNAEAMPHFDIPYEYHTDQAIVLTVDPNLVFAYWEITPHAMQQALSKVGPKAKLTLRFYDISKSGDPSSAPFWDMEVFDRLGNWYLRLDYPEQKLCLDVGMKNDRGHFHCLARSNIIKIPRLALAAPGKLKWMVVSPEGQKIITEVEEYTEADIQLLRRILGPHFFDLLMRGEFASITGSSLEAVFQDVSSLHAPYGVSSSPSSWSRQP